MFTLYLCTLHYDTHCEHCSTICVCPSLFIQCVWYSTSPLPWHPHKRQFHVSSGGQKRQISPFCLLLQPCLQCNWDKTTFPSPGLGFPFYAREVKSILVALFMNIFWAPWQIQSPLAVNLGKISCPAYPLALVIFLQLKHTFLNKSPLERNDASRVTW